MINKLVIILMFLFANKSYSQMTESKSLDKYKHAKLLVNPKYRFYNPQKALDIYTKGATEGNAEAMNGLGMLYMKGIGVIEDYQKAIYWFEKAVALNYAAAWHNAGLMYKNGWGTEQNFEKASEYFSKNAAYGHSQGQYSLGYMYYKGLGITQNYEKAFELFQKSAAKGLTGSMYMLGLCYRNGYGTAVNIDSARHWLAKVAEKGDKRAVAELGEPEPESSFEGQQSKSGSGVAIKPEEKTFKRIQQQRIVKDGLTGTYRGYIIRYDWSGTRIIGQNELELKLSGTDSLLTGHWKEDDSQVALQAKLADSALVFNNTTYSKKQHYHKDTPLELEFRDARLQLIKTEEGTYLAGNLQLYATQHREPANPIYINLVRVNDNQEILPVIIAQAKDTEHSLESKKVDVENEMNIEELKVYPNPFSKSFRASFYLKRAGKVKLHLSSMNGVQIYEETVDLPEGGHEREISVDVAAGVYVLRVSSASKVFSTLVVKQ